MVGMDSMTVTQQNGWPGQLPWLCGNVSNHATMGLLINIVCIHKSQFLNSRVLVTPGVL